MKTFFTISLIGALQGILLSLFFFLRGKNRIAMLMLGLYVFVFSTGLLENWFLENNDFRGGEVLSALISYSSFLYGPFLYLFVYYLTRGISYFQKKHFTHFLLFILLFGLQLILVLSNFSISKEVEAIGELIQFEILMIQILAYNVMAIKLLNKHYQSVLEIYSTIEEKDLRWLKLLLVIITCIYAFSFFLSHLIIFGARGIGKFFIIIQISITVCIYLMSYMVLLRPGLFNLSKDFLPQKNNDTNNTPETLNAVNETQSSLEKYKRSGLKPEQAQQHLLSLQNLMDIEKPYKNPDLNIHTLSQLLGISKNHLTQVLNEQLKMNFFEFINMYRVEEAKALLADPAYSHLSLQGIANEAGYKSKTTFFTNFRKITGLTPQEWLKAQQTPG